MAHLVEVEERRLHLEAAYSSMFTYCVGRLGMSEDEACRRIDLARLARRFPALFGELERGQLTLSVALVLKPVLTPENHLELLGAALGKSTEQARELVAARFPRQDAPSRIRKLPERRPVPASDLALPSSPASLSLATLPPGTLPPALERAAALPPQTPPPTSSSPRAEASSVPCAADPSTRSAFAPSAVVDGLPPLPAPCCPTGLQTHPEQASVSGSGGEGRASSAASSRGRIEPLSAQRYRVQFTADAELKHKLELARDLLRHAHPSGDFALIVSRALELLLHDLQRRRFGANKRSKGSRRVSTATAPSPAPLSPAVASAGFERRASAAGAASPAATASPAAPEPAAASPGAALPPPPRTPAASAAPAPATASPTATAPTPAAACSSPSPNSAAASGRAPSPSDVASRCPTEPAPKPRLPHLTHATRRAVLERDGLGCSFLDAHGVRCSSRAWLELDHRQPWGKGGSSEPDNVRLLCRAHNGLAAEHAYGRAHMERASRRDRQSRSPSA